MPHKRGEPYMFESELIDESEVDKAQNTSDEIQAIMDE